MLDDSSDPILTTIRRIGLFNSSADRVKVSALARVGLGKVGEWFRRKGCDIRNGAWPSRSPSPLVYERIAVFRKNLCF